MSRRRCLRRYLADNFSSSINCCQVLAISIGRIAVLGEQSRAHRVGLGLERPVILQQRQDGAELPQSGEVAGVYSGPGPGDPRADREDREDVGLAAHVAPLADLVLAQEMAAFVGDHAGQLRLVAHPQQQPGEDHG